METAQDSLPWHSKGEAMSSSGLLQTNDDDDKLYDAFTNVQRQLHGESL